MGAKALETARLITGLREQTAAFADLVNGRDPHAQVPTCPDWELRDLVGHIGQAHRWAAEIVKSCTSEIPQISSAPGVDDPRRWSGWLREGAEELIGAVGGTGPGATVWTFMGPRPPAFWVRRMLHDTSVHQADAAAATGGTFRIAPDLAADAIDEGLELLTDDLAATRKPELAALRGRGETLHLRPDAEPVAGWLITRTPGGATWTRSSTTGDVNVTGPVADLLRMFSRRLPPDDAAIEVTGDRALLDHWLAHTAF